MAKVIQAWTQYRPRLAPTDPMTSEEVIEQLVQATNQTRGSILAVLAELDVVIENSLKAGRIIHLPNGTNYRPIGKKDGTIKVTSRLNPRIVRQTNVAFRGKWLNSENIGITEEQVIAMWNAEHSNDPIEA